VLTIDRDHVPAREALTRLLIATARSAAAAGGHDNARSLIFEATDLMPDHPSTWQAIAELTTSQVERIDALRRLVALAPDHLTWRTQLRQALLARAVTIVSTDRAEARTRFREAASLNPQDVRIWQALANLADTEDERLQSLRQLLRVAPHHEEGRAVLRKALIDNARASSAAAQIDASLGYWREAIELTGGDVEVWLGLAGTTEDQDEKARAIETAQTIDRDDPRVLAALEWLHGPQVDPSVLPTTDDAFARFETSAKSPVAADDIGLNDSMLDAIATLPPIETVAPAEPAAAEVVVAEITPSDPPPVAVNTVATSAPTVMVVDDSPTIRKILGLTLERAGYRVVAEADGNSALARLKEFVPHVILLDIAMPDLDGYEVCKRIKQDPRTQAVPVIMLSGKGAFFDKVKGHMAGATEYLTKPFETPAVLAVVTTHCQAEAHHG
jgi:twitching motility two-component system response regulator PilG